MGVGFPLKIFCWTIRVDKAFEATGTYFGGLESIATKTLNHLNCVEAKIQVKQNLCGFIPSTIEIKDENRGNIFLNFGDIEL